MRPPAPAGGLARNINYHAKLGRWDGQYSLTRLVFSSLMARQKSNASEGDSCFSMFSIPNSGPTPVPCLVPLGLLPILVQYSSAPSHII